MTVVAVLLTVLSIVVLIVQAVVGIGLIKSMTRKKVRGIDVVLLTVIILTAINLAYSVSRLLIVTF